MREGVKNEEGLVMSNKWKSYFKADFFKRRIMKISILFFGLTEEFTVKSGT